MGYPGYPHPLKNVCFVPTGRSTKVTKPFSKCLGFTACVSIILCFSPLRMWWRRFKRLLLGNLCVCNVLLLVVDRLVVEDIKRWQCANRYDMCNPITSIFGMTFLSASAGIGRFDIDYQVTTNMEVMSWETQVSPCHKRDAYVVRFQPVEVSIFPKQPSAIELNQFRHLDAHLPSWSKMSNIETCQVPNNLAQLCPIMLILEMGQTCIELNSAKLPFSWCRVDM